MDGLALLCNLFADGPVTLKRLRLARIAHLGELERTEPAELALLLHASVPQARAFAEEARKLVRRLAEEQPAARGLEVRRLEVTPPSVAPRAPRASDVPPARSVASSPSLPDSARTTTAPAPGATPLRPELFPGLDEALCARLLQHQVRTVQALSEFAGLALARRTGIPYSTLLTLSRAARRYASERVREHAPGAGEGARGAPRRPEGVRERVHELVPFLAQPKRAPAEVELAGSDEFTLPQTEPESAGPFG